MILKHYQIQNFILTYFSENKYKYDKKKYINLVISDNDFLKIKEKY